jgi:hypothetical protein
MYQLYSANFLAKNAEHDESLEVSRHAQEWKLWMILTLTGLILG